MNAASPRRAAVPLPPLRVSTNAAAQAAGNVCHAAAQWGFIVALARLGTPAMVGQFALGLAITGPILLMASLKLRSVQATDAGRQNHFSDYLGLRLVTAGLAMVVVAGAALMFSRRDPAVFLIVVLVGVIKNLESISEVYRGFMQRAERMDGVAGSMSLRSLLALPVFVAVLWLGADLRGALLGVIVCDLIVLMSWDVRVARRLNSALEYVQREHKWLGVQPRYDAPTMTGLAATALPLGLVSMLLSLNSYAPQYAVKQLGDDATLGIFAALLYASMAPRMFFGAVGQAASPRLANLYEAGRLTAFLSLHRKLLRTAAWIGAAAVAGAVVLGRLFLHVAYGAEYVPYVQLFIELTIVRAIIHLVSAQEYTVTATRAFRAQLPVALISAGTTVVAAFLLTPALGLRGAAAAMLAGALVQGFGYSVILHRQVQTRRAAHLGCETA